MAQYIDTVHQKLLQELVANNNVHQCCIVVVSSLCEAEVETEL